MTQYHPADLGALSDLLSLKAGCSRRPLSVAIDGRSGTGKSTLAAVLAADLGATLVEGDDFYAGGTSIREEPPACLVRSCIDWVRQRAVLESLRAGHRASWRAFDWETFDGRLLDEPTCIEPRQIIILEGVYSARPELADLIDLSVLLKVDEPVRQARLLAREGEMGAWEYQWQAAEDFYFKDVRPEQQFDVLFAESGFTGAGSAAER